MNEILSIINFFLIIGAFLGGVAAYKHGFNKTANEVQERVINALKADLDRLREQLNEVRRENTRLQDIYEIICTALKKQGIIISITGDMVDIRDQKGNFVHQSRIVEDEH